jgi:hypothetical protein
LRRFADIAQIPALAIARVLDAKIPMLAIRRLIAGFAAAGVGRIGRNVQDRGDGGAHEGGSENGGRNSCGSA